VRPVAVIVIIFISKRATPDPNGTREDLMLRANRRRQKEKKKKKKKRNLAIARI